MNPASAAQMAVALQGSLRSRPPPAAPVAPPPPAAAATDALPGNLVRFRNGRGAFVLADGTFQFLPGTNLDDRVPLYNRADRARYMAAARALQMG